MKVGRLDPIRDILNHMVNPQDIGISSSRLTHSYKIVERFVEEEPSRGAAMLIGRYGQYLEPRVFGYKGVSDYSEMLVGDPVEHDTIFLIASPTKPVTSLAVCILIERGLITLDQPVKDIIPELSQDKHDMRILQILTHTSGLPDALPNNHRLRAEHMPLETFIDEVYSVPLDFQSGTRVKYQSLGFALQSEIVRRVTGIPLPEFLSTEVFGPLGMRDTFLGRTSQDRSRIADIVLTKDQLQAGWTWNGDYWHKFGAPWGGLFSTVGDYARLLQLMLDGGTTGGVEILSRSMAVRMTTDNLGFQETLSSVDRANRTWGLGWMMRESWDPSPLGDVVSEYAFGHWGVSGTVVWADPKTSLVFVMFTNQPESPAWLGMVSNAVAGSILG